MPFCFKNSTFNFFPANSLWITIAFIFIVLFSGSVKAYASADSNKVTDNIIPMSQINIPDDKKELAGQKCEKILGLFKTPEQQFMPLGMYDLHADYKNVEVMRKLRLHGINLIHRYGISSFTGGAQGTLDAARQAGIGVMQDIAGSIMRDNSPQWLREHVRKIAGDKQLLFWYLPEETDSEDLVKTQMLADIIRSEDPCGRPITTWQPFYDKNSDMMHWQSISKITDAMIQATFPCYEQDKYPRGEIKTHIDIGYESGALVVFSCLEAFNGESFDKKNKYNRRWPRPDEIRFDAYLSLLSGSKGIFWYSHAYIKDNPVIKYASVDNVEEWNRKAAEIYETILEIAYQLNGPTRLGEVFLRGTEVESIKCRLISGNVNAPSVPVRNQQEWWEKPNLRRIYHSIQWKALRFNKHIYIFAVNMNEKIGDLGHGGKDYTVTVKFENLPDNIKSAEVLFEGRQLALDANSFSDSFEPIGTHIYRLDLE